MSMSESADHVPPVSSEVTPAGPAGYPVSVSADPQESFVRFLPLVKWLLLVPHYIALFFLAIGAAVVAFIAFFAVLFTGTYPRGMWNFMAGFYRWTLRVTAYMMLMTDRYPPFTLEETGEDDVRLSAEYPERVERWRPFVAWLLVIPYLIVASLILMVAQICSFLAFFTIIFTKRIPDGIFDVMRVGLNWQMRANFYAYWMSTEYPPFSWDDE
jgi:hypothetical protein